MQTTQLINSLDRVRILESFTPAPGRRNRVATQIAYGVSPAHIQRLLARLQTAEAISPPMVPADMVTMNSIIRLEDQLSGAIRRCVLVYPQLDDVDLPEGVEQVSIETELGSELLGRRVGDLVELVRRGRAAQLRIASIEFQPEAAGKFDL